MKRSTPVQVMRRAICTIDGACGDPGEGRCTCSEGRDRV